MRDNTAPTAFKKADLAGAVAAVDTFVESNTTALNNALPAQFRNNATATQKALVYAYVFMRRASILHAEEDG